MFVQMDGEKEVRTICCKSLLLPAQSDNACPQYHAPLPPCRAARRSCCALRSSCWVSGVTAMYSDGLQAFFTSAL